MIAIPRVKALYIYLNIKAKVVFCVITSLHISKIYAPLQSYTSPHTQFMLKVYAISSHAWQALDQALNFVYPIVLLLQCLIIQDIWLLQKVMPFIRKYPSLEEANPPLYEINSLFITSPYTTSDVAMEEGRGGMGVCVPPPIILEKQQKT